MEGTVVPQLIRKQSGRTRVVSNREAKRYGRLDHYEVVGECDWRGRLLSEAPAPAVASPPKPDVDANKPAWVAYARSRDVDTYGLTKAEIIAKVG